MKILEYIALVICILNILVFVGDWDLMIIWGVITVFPLAMIIYRKLKEQHENKI